MERAMRVENNIRFAALNARDLPSALKKQENGKQPVKSRMRF
jgi:hypothetical protein